MFCRNVGTNHSSILNKTEAADCCGKCYISNYTTSRPIKPQPYVFVACNSSSFHFVDQTKAGCFCS